MIEKKNIALCPCCMEEHEQQTCKIEQSNIINGVKVNYDALYEYCQKADEYYATEQQIRQNAINAKDAYRITLCLRDLHRLKQMDRKEDTDMHSDANDSKERAALLRAMQAEQERQRVREQILQDRIAMNQALTAAEQANEATRATFAQSFQDPFSPFFIQR